MHNGVSLKVFKQLDEIDAIFRELLTHQIIPDRIYTQITAKIGHIDSNYMNDQFKQADAAYYHWVKNRLDKISALIIRLQKQSPSSISGQHEDLMHTKGDYYNEDNTIPLTNEMKQSITTIINETYANHE